MREVRRDVGKVDGLRVHSILFKKNMRSKLERDRAFTHLMVLKHGERIQYQLAHHTFEEMDKAYQSYRDTLSDPRAAEIEEMIDFRKKVSLLAIKFFREIFEGAFKGVERAGGGVRVEEPWKRVGVLADMYTCLIEEEDSDGQLREFLERYPDFAEHIGGMPRWLKERPSSPRLSS